MFTGIVEELGSVVALERTADAARLTVRGPKVVSDAQHGGSIAVNGVCLTVVAHDAETFTADVMAITLDVTTLGTLQPGDPVNLERAAMVGDRLGGHIVQGHVDGAAAVLAVEPGEQWRVVRMSLPAELASLVTRKGSIAVDGVSLTVAAVGDDWFEVSLIPETLAVTTLGVRAVGDAVNLETDVLARHVERMLQLGAVTAPGAAVASSAGGAA